VNTVAEKAEAIVTAAFASQFGEDSTELFDSDDSNDSVKFLPVTKRAKLAPESVLPQRNFAWAALKEFQFGEFSVTICVGITNNQAKHYLQICSDGKSLGKTKRFGKNITAPIEAVKALLKVLTAAKKELQSNPSCLKFLAPESAYEPWDTKLDYHFDWVTSMVYFALRVYASEKENPAVLFLEQVKNGNGGAKIGIEIPLVAHFNDFFRAVSQANQYRKLNNLS
jgi:hypothetical protein